MKETGGMIRMRDMTFQYGGKHFMPVRKFEQKDGDFYQITRRLRLDAELGIFREGYCLTEDEGIVPYSPEAFYQKSTDKTCDIFRCMENGKLYVPCEYGLQEYVI